LCIFREFDPPLFELADAVLAGRDDRRQLGVRDPVEKLFDVAFDLRKLSFQAKGLSVG
jgi:hypothetical protein